MITYNRSAFGLNLLFRVHGSAVYRSILPSLISVGVFCLLRFYRPKEVWFGDSVGDAYTIGVLVAATTFLIVFRVDRGYSRYWEAASSTHQMMSKWMDATVHASVFHLQCSHYEKIKPPSFFDYPELNHLYMTRDRERRLPIDDDDDDDDSQDSSIRRSLRSLPFPHVPHYKKKQSKHVISERERSKRRVEAVIKSINYVQDPTKRRKTKGKQTQPPTFSFIKSPLQRCYSASDVDDLDMELDETEFSPNCVEFFDKYQQGLSMPGTGKPFRLFGKPRMDGNWGNLYDKNPEKSTYLDPQNPNAKSIPKEGFASIQGGRTPPLFLQELAHLSSLLVAVALSTLRNDIDGTESPLTFYEPGCDWPTLDPDKDEWLNVEGFVSALRRLKDSFALWRSPKYHIRYNALRPLPVIGGVSDAEIHFLQMARGPYAKTQLCWNWLSEFIIREHLAGSTGMTGPPIISRLFQFLSDGMIHYNHARKIMFIPFPFVHAQICVLFIVVLIPLIPLLMDQYIESVALGACLTFFTVLGLSGIHEVARELENPYRNFPNNLPFVNMQAQYNESLVTMYSGFHPDHFWNGESVLRKRLGKTSARKDSSTTEAPTGNAWNESFVSQDLGVSGSRSSSSTNDEAPSRGALRENEITSLKKQLADQAKLIEQMAAKVNFQPERELQQLETIVQDAATIINNYSSSTLATDKSDRSIYKA